MRPALCTIPLLAAGLALLATTALADNPTRQSSPKLLSKGVLKGTGTPDLIIEPRYAGQNGLPGTGFCGPWNGGNQTVRFYVTNTGSAAAPASDVFIGYGAALNDMVAVPALAPGQSTERSAQIPLAAWGPGGQIHGVVDLIVAADHNDDVPEANVTNNYGEGECIGPAG